ncbi:MAG TPA: DUF1732 domain-containing protein, partial [Pirellulaceae bacterium]
MLISMTGHGDASVSDPRLTVRVEVRAVNHRHFKVSLRGSETCFAYEPQIEALVRPTIRRGALQVGLRMERALSPMEYRVRTDVIANYRAQIRDAFGARESESVSLATFLGLPGVIPESNGIGERSDDDWPVMAEAIQKAVGELQRMRVAEGRAMETDLRSNCAELLSHLETIATRAPLVATAYRDRLLERLQKFLTDREATISPAETVREVALFCERSDISEELVRLRSHVEQFLGAIAEVEPVGRKLDFLTQEMFRETNTIGSKANDVEISR